MRISDWSSDVGSSDLAWSAPPGRAGRDGEKKSGSWLSGRGVPRMRRGSASPDGRMDAAAGESLYTASEEAGGRIMADFPERTLDDWQALATKELKDRKSVVSGKRA